MLELWVIISYLALGAIVGFFAGLLGIGGGGIIVPLLTSLFIIQGFAYEHIVHMALATSMATIIFTSISSVYSHHRHQAVIWPIIIKISPGIILGTLLMSSIVTYIPTLPLALLFSVFMAFIALQMIVNKKPKPSRQVPSLLPLSFVGSFIGALSALVAIGGGSLSVPFLMWCNVNIKKAIATSAGIGFIIALSASLGYWLSGLEKAHLPPYSSGYIYWPAVLLITCASVFTAPLGVNMAHKLPVKLLRFIFALLLIGLSIKMLVTIYI